MNREALGPVVLVVVTITLGPLSVDGVEVAVSVASLFSGLYGFFLRNRRFFDTPASAEQSSNPA